MEFNMPNVWAQEKALQASPEQAKAIDTWTANFAVQAATYVAPLVAIQRPPGVQPVAE
ncbi:MAG: hypothetical protein WAL10_12140 [Acetobacteraceae bacterium]|jgi:hypothetical protein